MSGVPTPAPGSFRDPCGRVYRDGDRVLRTIAPSYAPHWEALEASGFLAAAVKSGLLLGCSEVEPFNGAWKAIEAPLLPFISYPYEWSFSQLKDAALHTLALMDLALAHGQVLKDATAYNVQFVGPKSVFIDHLSFERRNPHVPWAAYRQFCQHFLAPLALMAKAHVGMGRLPALWVDGISLDMASALLPWRTRLSPSLQMHIHAHARLQTKYSDARKAAAKIKAIDLSERTVPRLVESLRMAVEGLNLPKLETEWAGYYGDTNYTDAAAADKAAFVERVAAANGGRLAVDLGANTGRYSALLTKHFGCVLAPDVDPLAVEMHYQALKGGGPTNVTPLVLDLANPSPAIGWSEAERPSFSQRCRADLVGALALVHHLVFGAGIPLAETAGYFRKLLRPCATLLLEFVPLEDSQVQRLLAARKNPFPDYGLEACIAVYAPYFELVERHKVAESQRTLLVFRKRGAL